MRSNCPCCGAALEAYPADSTAKLLSPVMGEIVRKLASQPGEFVSSRELADYIWKGTPDGGPLHARNSINNTIAYNKERLRALGWEISSRTGQHGGYMLRAAA